MLIIRLGSQAFEILGKRFRGYLDRLRENVEVLDEAIASARKPSTREAARQEKARSTAPSGTSGHDGL